MSEREDWDDAPAADEEMDDVGDRDVSEAGIALAQMHGQLLRMRADFENYRRRSSSASADARKEERASVLKALLPVYDNFIRALESAETHEEVLPYLQGLEMIRGQLESFFADQGAVAVCPSAGDSFDPNLHEASGVVPVSSNDEAETVAHLVQCGFVMGDLLLRPAQVLVFSGGD